jgi:hypothetical protein
LSAANVSEEGHLQTIAVQQTTLIYSITSSAMAAALG